MRTVTVDKQAVRDRIYRFTAAKSRFIGENKTNQELYTFDMEESDRELNAMPVNEFIPLSEYSYTVNLYIHTGSEAGGFVYVKLDGKYYAVNCGSGTAEEVASMIRASYFEGWKTSGEGVTVTFTRASHEAEVPPEFDGDQTGITGSMSSEENVQDGIKVETRILPTTYNKIILDVNAESMTLGTFLIRLDGVDYYITTTEVDSATLAANIRAAQFPGWTVTGSGTSAIFTKNTPTGVASLGQFDALQTGIVGTFTDVTKTIKTAKLQYMASILKDDIVSLTRQKGRNVADKNGLTLIDRISMSDTETEASPIIPSKNTIFTLCQRISAKKAQVYSIGGQGTFDNLTLTADDSPLFDDFYNRAFSDLMADLATLVSAYTKNTSFTPAMGFPQAIGDSVTSNVEMYLFSRVMEQFYRMLNIPADADLFGKDAFGYIFKVRDQITAQTNATSILKVILKDAAVRVQTALYPLSKRTDGITFVYGDTLDFSMELKELPISKSALQLVFNLCRSVLVNGALAKWYTMAGIADDKNEAKVEMEASLMAIAFLIEDRLRLLGLYDQYFEEATNDIRGLLLGYSKNLNVAGFSLDDTTATFNFERTLWDNSILTTATGATEDYSVNFYNNLQYRINEAVYHYILKEWFRLFNQEEYNNSMREYDKATMDVRSAIEVQHQPRVRGYSWM